MESDSGYIVVYITAPEKETGRKLAQVLVERQLAACVNIVGGIESIYSWEGKIQQDQEVLLICKTRSELFGEKFIQEVKEIHPYENPEIIALPIIGGAKEYVDWIFDVTKGTSRDGL